ncbi:DNA adenine methylase [Thermoanaerobacterium sp. R66]|uniref:DNA adenine methylase n=1 Tax=Thermoanaerobacterium sp. R66 TaxID=2742479 RepID=UPI002380A11B|nr:DNA adenine methylase [Thermoanaerobacterium sp. R66]MDE4542246.1 DNA adenine methylase [Thermoanaerobacterium sp. R66]
MSSRRTYTPLRYPGGKNKLTGYVKKILIANNLKGCIYIEPFAGGAAIALALLIDGYASEIIINDIDRSIYAFWYSVLNHTDELCYLIENTPINIDQWHKQKDIQRHKNSANLLELGFSTFFLNRTNRSGILKAGVIGGLEQNGKYKMDCRFNKKQLIDKIRYISKYKNNIKIFNMDTIQLLDIVLPKIETKSFIFFDPPYYNKGSTLYVNYYNHEDHLKLSKKIGQIKEHYWIVTYDYVKAISEMYSQYFQTTYKLNYTAQRKYTGYEIMIYSNNLNVPKECKNVI